MVRSPLPLLTITATEDRPDSTGRLLAYGSRRTVGYAAGGRGVMAATLTEMARRDGWKNHRLYLPAYRFSEAARLVGTTAQTITRWYRGYDAPGHRMRPVLPPAGTGLLSYLQLVEVALVADIRRLGVPLERLRLAHEYCRKTFSREFPFAELSFKTDGVHVLCAFGEHAAGKSLTDALIATDSGGQLVWREAVKERLDQFDYEEGLALRWHPRGRDSVIIVDPRVAFGAPMIGESGVPTSIVRERFDAGEDLDEIEEDFGVSREELVEALRFEGVHRHAA